ncbi:MAG: TRAP transporter small permease [Rhodoferax sp.]|jgi:TRAP-type C4-dicarboxylate transport system permease small subunit|nr:TRAP transporter small permease [Rhodoferax sp.]
MPAESAPLSSGPGAAPVPPWLVRLLRIDGGIGRLEEWIGIALVAAMAVVVNLQIVARYVFDKPFIWPEEVARLILVWMAFVGAAALIRRGGDIAVDTFIDMLAPARRRAMLLLRDLLMVAVYTLVAWQGWRLAGNVAGMPLVATEWPTALLAWPVVVGGVLVVLHVLVRRACAWAGMAPLAHTAQASA